MEVKIEKSWKEVLHEEFAKPYFQTLIQFVKQEYSSQTIFPPGSLIFSAFDKTPFDKVKVVILGQDPYHTPGVANGMAFSVQHDKLLPPSLRNIFKELQNDMGVNAPANGDLSYWAEQGVLLLNATLTVRKGLAGSHQKKGWEEFTDAVTKIISDKKENVVFILWGAYAQKKGEIINKNKHHIIQSAHPSPFSAERGFFGSRPFTKANTFLSEKGIAPIKWA
jgi:uracil-DNA glycosylase